MNYHLSWADFEVYLRNRAPSAETALPATAGGDSLARTYVWKRFQRCHDPLRARSLYPKPRNCDPAVFNDAAHWDNVYQRLVKLRTIDAEAVHATEATLLGPSDPEGVDDPWALVADPDSEVEAIALTELEVDDLRASIVEQFNTDVPFGPELQQAMLVGTYNLGSGFGGDFFETVKESLVEQLPSTFEPGPNGRQRLKRALDRSRAFVSEELEGR